MCEFKTGGYCPRCLNPDGECTCLMNFWNIVGDNGEKRVFKIPVGDIPEDNVKECVKELTEDYFMPVRNSDSEIGDESSLPGAVLDYETDIKYFKEKRDFYLKFLVKLIKLHEPDEKIENYLKKLLRVNNQLKMVFDASIYASVIKAKDKTE